MRVIAPRFLAVLAAVLVSSPAAAGNRVAVAGVTLEPPDGWKVNSLPDGSGSLVNPEGDIVWRIFPTEPASDLAAWFDGAFAALSSAHATVNAGPVQETAAHASLVGRAGMGVMFEARGTRHILLLSAVSDGAVVVPMLIEFAGEAGLARRAELNEPAESIELVPGSARPKRLFASGGWRYPLSGAAGTAKGAAPNSPPAAATAPPGEQKLPFPGRWSSGKSASNPRDGVSYGSRMYQYDFLPGGSYAYHSEAWGGTFGSNWYYVVEEKGEWTVSGNQLTLAPTQVTGVVRDLAGNVQKNGGPPPERVTYRFQTTYFSGLGETQLVLTPPRPTSRDGAFSTIASFPNSYLLRPNFKSAFRFPP